jgi:hypothetical protein
VAKHKKERIRVEQSSGSGWTSRLLSDGTRHGDAVLLQLDDINGRAYIVMAHSDEKDYLLTTHQ